MQADFEKVTLNFKTPSGTSRGILHQKDSWLIRVWHNENPSIKGIGEASIIKSLSPDWSESYEEKIAECCASIDTLELEKLKEYPSIKFAFESALMDLENVGKQVYFPSDFTAGKTSILINGLIWMGDKGFMLDQIDEKIELGFSCIKMKIGAIDFETELDILQSIRKKYPTDKIELRVDANGAFSPQNALNKLEKLAEFDLHSIEQPIKPKQWQEMASLCEKTPLPIALDEELIGLTTLDEMTKMLLAINPQYIILKPSLLGGFSATDKWIELAENQNIGWWITSALESNVGLNAIAQYTFTKNNKMPQGLGTGQLFTNNIPSNLNLIGQNLWFKP